MMKALILGMGLSGQAASNFLQSKGYTCEGFDDRQKAPVPDLTKFDLLVLSPGIAPIHPVLQLAKKHNLKIIGECELGMQHVSSKQVVGITGTNGKSTTTSLVVHVLNVIGKKAVAIGNIGIPITQYLLEDNSHDILVIELSSFQLETMHTKSLDIGVFLNFSEDHLDRYTDMQEYFLAKKNIESILKEDATFFAHTHLKGRLSKPCIFLEGPSETFARAICRKLGVNNFEFDKAIKTFPYLEHRLEFVKEIDGTSYYNDSKGTNISSVCYAITQLKSPIVLLVGGKDKGVSFSALINHKSVIKHVVAFGSAASRILQELKQEFNICEAKDLKEAITIAKSIAKEKEIILLSPGCASFDAFKNFEHRGNMFKQIVNQL